VRADAQPLREALGRLVHQPTWLAVQAERALSRTLGGSCSVPLAAHARWLGSDLQLTAALGATDDPTRPLLRAVANAGVADDDSAQHLGRQVAEALRAQGADQYLLAAS
jgi:hydroxymethylbilane synthase